MPKLCRDLLRDTELASEIPHEWIAMMVGERPQLIKNASVVRVDTDFVWFDVGAKFESAISIKDWDGEPPPQVGDQFCVMIDNDSEVEDRPLNIIRLEVHSDPLFASWVSAMNAIAVGNTYSGRIARRISGGFLVDVGVNTYLPDDAATPEMLADIDAWIEKQIGVRVTYIDESRRNIYVAPE